MGAFCFLINVKKMLKSKFTLHPILKEMDRFAVYLVLKTKTFKNEY
jgi:hypothetical protein